MINYQRVRRIKHIIKITILILLLLPAVFAVVFFAQVRELKAEIASSASSALPGSVPGADEVIQPQGQSFPSDQESRPVGRSDPETTESESEVTGESESTASPGAQSQADPGDSGDDAAAPPTAAPHSDTVVPAAEQGQETQPGAEKLPAVSFETPPGSSDAPNTGAEHVVYLTFSNALSSDCREILDVLDRYGAKATFFVWGSDTSGDFYSRVVEKGHAIGIQCDFHDKPLSQLYSSKDAFMAEFAKVLNAIHEATGVETRLYRLSGDSANSDRRQVIDQVKAELDSRGFWDISARDAVSPALSENQVLNNLLKAVEAGETVVLPLYDGSNSTVRALDRFLEHCVQQGYVFVALDETTIAISFID